jgi:hypothetical protein
MTAPVRSSRWTRPQPFAVVAFALALSAWLVLLFAPLGSQVETTAIPPSPSSAELEPAEPTVTHPSLLSTDGWRVAFPLSVAVVLAAGGLLASARHAPRVLQAVAVSLGAWVLLGVLSIGIYYLPAEAAMIVAAMKERRR